MRLLVSRSNAATWIAEENRQIAGFAIVEWSERESTAYIQTIEVAPEARSRGVGRELLGSIESSARFAGAGLIWLHVEEANAAAIRLYEAHGYRCEGRQEDYYPQRRAALIYVKRLDAEAST
jgi:ribosomal protein S18 acetylase RimI-like enzyme